MTTQSIYSVTIRTFAKTLEIVSKLFPAIPPKKFFVKNIFDVTTEARAGKISLIAIAVYLVIVIISYNI